ncbi:MAG: PEP-CTERM sorting domain-containing protein [Acidobacteriaceae bacterium]|nr:PEP-CTERM sorting domain-containing protein [Acidobacteriaceae bacterium]MBV9296709.1 PEP-CTERM sorting domain-containing protein [Acidobacteriaceae bacterium]MBV9767440.1 PEP-CTERM sorting domain-containing protein [Acidobacteriaceae bacterium]
MIKRFSILALGLAIALPSAFGSPMVYLSLQETGFAADTANSSSGFVSLTTGSYGDFQINNVTGTGSPVFSAPDLNLQTLNVSATTLSSSKTLTIELTQTGITGVPTPFNFDNAFTGILKGVTSETLTTYTDPGNTAFATTDMVATTTFTTSGANSVNQMAIAPTGTPFSETEIIVATFGPTTGVSDSLDSSILMGSAVPEPTSIALLGGGLLGLALIRRRSSKKS